MPARYSNMEIAKASSNSVDMESASCSHLEKPSDAMEVSDAETVKACLGFTKKRKAINASVLLFVGAVAIIGIFGSPYDKLDSGSSSFLQSIRHTHGVIINGPTEKGSDPQRRKLNLINFADPKSTTTKMPTVPNLQNDAQTTTTEIEPLSFTSLQHSTNSFPITNSNLNTNLNSNPNTNSNPDTFSKINQSKTTQLPPLPRYSLTNILHTLPAYYHELFLLIYHHATDDFSILLDESIDTYVGPVKRRIENVAPVMATALRRHFEHKLSEWRERGVDFILLFSTGNEPKIVCECLFPETRKGSEHSRNICRNEDFAPILQFGATYREDQNGHSLLPNMVLMPSWQYLWCFNLWVERGEVCEAFLPKKSEDSPLGLVYSTSTDSKSGNNHGSNEAEDTESQQWNNLIPQLFWRGSDYSFLSCYYPQIHKIEFERDILPILESFPRHGPHAHPNAKAHMLLQFWERMTPRWKAVALGVVAEWEVNKDLSGGDALALTVADTFDQHNQQQGVVDLSTIPWIDVKFSLPNTGSRRPPVFTSHGLTIHSPPLTLSQLAHYKYHIDLGGGGGTTWTGTIQKLALPGVLFHHVTPTYDWIHDDMEEWVHYIPVSVDLSDLKEKVLWSRQSENNDQRVKEISQRGRELSRFMGTGEYWEYVYDKFFVRNLGRVVEAYDAYDEGYNNGYNSYGGGVGGNGNHVGEVLARMREVARCTGRGPNGGCKIDGGAAN